MIRVFCICSCIAAATVGGAGCGTPVGRVEGQVSFDGVPVASGAISFAPTDGNSPPEGGEIKDGKYSVEGLVPGQKIVLITAVKQSGPISSADLAAEAANRAKTGGAPPSEPVDLIPANAEGNNAQHEIKAGQQTLDFHLKKPAAK